MYVTSSALFLGTRWESCLSRGESQRQQARVLHGASGDWNFATVQGSMCKHCSPAAGFSQGSNHRNPKNDPTAPVLALFQQEWTSWDNYPRIACPNVLPDHMKIPNILLWTLNYKFLKSCSQTTGIRRAANQPSANLISAKDYMCSYPTKGGKV